MTPQEIAEKWLIKNGIANPIISELSSQDALCLNERTFKVDLSIEYPCPTLSDGEYRGEDLESYYHGKEPFACHSIRLKQTPAIDAGEAVDDPFKILRDGLKEHCWLITEYNKKAVKLISKPHQK